jgi:hypothetical protein
MSLPSTILGVTAKQLLVLVTVGCLAAYLLSNHDETSAQDLAIEAFIRSQERVAEQVGTVVSMTLVRQMVAYPLTTRRVTNV